MSVQTVRSISEWRSVRSLSQFEGKTVGFVPTMGALHAGHEDLFQKARRECDFVVGSIFVNPTQFNDPKDFQNYPKTWDNDLAVLDRAQADFLFAPTFDDIYPDNYKYVVTEKEFSKQLCGAHRPGHFDGVLTIVMKLLHLVAPTHAYFGEKDYQQLQLISGMVDAFFMDIKIVPCPTVRDEDGLALSSRNARLTPAGRAHAALFPKFLSENMPLSTIRKNLETAGFRVDYVEEYNGRRFGAVFYENVRLIDNVKI